MYRVTAINVSRIWIEWAERAALSCMANSPFPGHVYCRHPVQSKERLCHSCGCRCCGGSSCCCGSGRWTAPTSWRAKLLNWNRRAQWGKWWSAHTGSITTCTSTLCCNCCCGCCCCGGCCSGGGCSGGGRCSGSNYSGGRTSCSWRTSCSRAESTSYRTIYLDLIRSSAKRCKCSFTRWISINTRMSTTR